MGSGDMCVPRQNFTTLNLFVSFLFYFVFIFYLMMQTCTLPYGYLHLTQGVDITCMPVYRMGCQFLVASNVYWQIRTGNR